MNRQLILMIRAEAVLILVFLGYIELADRHFLSAWRGIRCVSRSAEFYCKLAGLGRVNENLNKLKPHIGLDFNRWMAITLRRSAHQYCVRELVIEVLAGLMKAFPAFG